MRFFLRAHIAVITGILWSLPTDSDAQFRALLGDERERAAQRERSGDPEFPVEPGHPEWLSAMDALARARSGAISLELIMSDPRWIARSPERPYFSDDGSAVYYRRDRLDEPGSDLYRRDLHSGEVRLIEPAEFPDADAPGVHSPGRRRKAFARDGDLFLKNLETGELTQLTRTAQREHSPRFTADGGGLMFRVGDSWRVRDLESGLVDEPADLRTEDDPGVAEREAREKAGYLEKQQRRLFEHVRDARARERAIREQRRTERAENPARIPPPFYLGKGTAIVGTELSPNLRWLAVRLAPAGDRRGKRDTMPNYATASGYVETRRVRAKVGTDTPRPERLVILDLHEHTQHEIDLAVLPAIDDDPLARLKESKKKTSERGEGHIDDAHRADEPGSDSPEGTPADQPEPTPRPVRFTRLTWSDDGQRLAIQAMSFDRKDRWIARVDLDEMTLRPVEHLRDEAWINWRANAIGWLPDNRTLWFLSERTGYAHLHVHEPGAEAPTQVTSGEFVVDRVRFSLDGEAMFVRANRSHPGSYDVHRYDLRARRRDGLWRGERITTLGGRMDYWVSPEGDRLLLRRSGPVQPPELFIQDARPGAAPRRVTNTITDAFISIDWTVPAFVEVPSSHVDRVIHARLYRPDPEAANGAGVVFIHGAGYLQNAHKGWSRYFREFMFHSLLTARGYTVLDMDYRASAGYGRDWRTAIYRRMGTPELEDLRDGVEWLVATEGIDRDRVGVYGGSYGGFLTLMALFREPDLFACGAALRPVTDWAHYNHGYTANILNVPQLDPEAYEGSSPIEFAEGLERPLLICHGMLDDNVLYQDTVRLAQRLVELGKDGWEVASYPVEPHGFERPASWRDEYQRILELFETHLRVPGGTPGSE